VCDRSRLSAENELQRTAERLHALGSLPLFHFLAEIVGGRDITETLNRYTALDPEVVRSLGADSVDATATADQTARLLHSRNKQKIKTGNQKGV
jgi:hypothetical protein